MPNDIRYVVLSDMHLGQDQSLLTHLEDFVIDPTQASPVLQKLMECLAVLIGHNQAPEPPTLVLLGDIIELALTEANLSSMVFQRFAELWLHGGRPLFGKVVYIPGNHDHHVWETVREQAYLDYVASLPANQVFAPTPHSTELVAGVTIRGTIITTLIERALGEQGKSLPVQVNYPNFALRSPARLVLFHHGHYFESIYQAMSELGQMAFPGSPRPQTVADIEHDNFGWIDFFWSAMGRQGPVGAEVEKFYDAMAFPAKFDKIINNIVESLLAEWEVKGIRRVEKIIARDVLEWLVRHYLMNKAAAERQHPDEVLSDAGKKGVHDYVEGALRKQVVSELGAMPEDVTLIFGHTHKPFEDSWSFQGISQKPVPVYNTGGWAIDPASKILPLHGGAAVLLDEELDAVSLRLFNEQDKGASYRVNVAHVGPKTAFAQRMEALVDPTREPFASFARAVASGIEVRYELVKRIVG